MHGEITDICTNGGKHGIEVTPRWIDRSIESMIGVRDLHQAMVL